MSDLEAINGLREEYIAAANAGDVDGWLATLTDDAVFMPPNELAVAGKAAIRSWVVKSFFDPFDIQLSFSHQEVEVAGDWAFVQGRFSYSLTPKAGGEVIEESGKFIDILKRQSDGSFKYARAIWNSDNPLPGQ
ncbi:nuclear transport factor 2 family protein [Acidobacteria bacterium AH-259-L09]|nr:nuclear transport factor 2 family protein [Acidobacteria bacterium AH-259-L09]